MYRCYVCIDVCIDVYMYRCYVCIDVCIDVLLYVHELTYVYCEVFHIVTV